MNTTFKYLTLFSCLFVLTNCSDSDGTSATASETANTSSAVAALFTGFGDAGESLPAAIARTQSTCADIENDPENVDSAFVDPDLEDTDGTEKTYGPTTLGDDHNVTLTEDDFCGTAENETQDVYAYFSLSATVTATCSDSTTLYLLSGSEGVWIQDSDEGKCPEIFGTFSVSSDAGETDVTVNCHLILGCDEDDGTVTEANCENADTGEELTLESDNTCEINAE